MTDAGMRGSTSRNDRLGICVPCGAGSIPEVANAGYDSGMQKQVARFHEALEAGMPRLGWKVALSDPMAMERLGISEPAIAWLDGRRLLPAGARYTPPAGARTSVEAEVAIHIGDDGRIDVVAPAIEFVDLSRPAGSIEAMLGHAVFHEAVMFGASMPFESWRMIDWPPQGWPVIRKNGDVAATFAPQLAPDDFAALVVAKRAQLEAAGEALEPGDWIITGSLTTPVPVMPDDNIAIDYGALGQLATAIDEPA